MRIFEELIELIRLQTTISFKKVVFSVFIRFSLNPDDMQTQNYTSSFLNFFQKGVIDELGNPIFTVHFNSIPSPIKYTPIVICFNSLVKEVQVVSPQIKETSNMQEIEMLGFIVISVPVPKGGRAWTTKRKMYQLVSKRDISPLGLKRLKTVRVGKDKNHKFQIDESNNLIRMVGPQVGPTGESDWLEIPK